ncbi:PTS sugar transporter subunit IIA [Mammaliicoccus stepanovicii]|uniref:PTS system, mannose/fructose/N -acetylgalactosamine-specific component IIA n=1 Tax=Mammaliicoccus stepanovicii TaxID=643214 RepID=A0A239YD02_9STAP|nr:PTS sugar transporter subunit IIA [Mammaliicoccus stepanovicii]PNZ75529.1 PTS fructose transporter subunit IIA [Mammaliicoccus stepanovicii]GGI42601.1 PTS fructose transporter subunit IIA [Mammaliicoccus stepanovicii]SNV56572.1 PTS system, mannose/fructose/N -acetylgalactosamine-specific component IIA [Mammaliicoccus stepanovicii]
MRKLVLASHGSFCEGLKESVEMILGPQENIVTVSLLPDDGKEDYENKFKQVINDEDDITVFTDLLGGTPANVISKELMTGQNFKLYAGMNLPMVIAYLNGEMLDQEVDIVNETKQSIVHVNELLQDINNDDDE